MMVGQSARATMDDNIVLDFSGLFNTDSNTSRLQENCLPKEPATQLLQYKRQREEDHKKCSEICREYQANILKSSQMQTEILKGIKSGENGYILLLKASKAISFMTGNELFYKQVEADINAIHGVGLKQKVPLEKLLCSAKTRLELLKKAKDKEPDEDTKRRIINAIKAHERRIIELEDELKCTEILVPPGGDVKISGCSGHRRPLEKRKNNAP